MNEEMGDWWKNTERLRKRTNTTKYSVHKEAKYNYKEKRRVIERKLETDSEGKVNISNDVKRNKSTKVKQAWQFF